MKSLFIILIEIIIFTGIKARNCKRLENCRENELCHNKSCICKLDFQRINNFCVRDVFSNGDDCGLNGFFNSYAKHCECGLSKRYLWRMFC
jgi:hypothetical protein